MKKLVFASLFSASFIGAFAQAIEKQAPMNRDTLDATAVIMVDTTGGAKQVPNDPSLATGERRTVTDSTKTRYAQGGKPAHDVAHTKQHPAKKDTTHVPMTTYTKKTTRSYHRHTATTTTNK